MSLSLIENRQIYLSCRLQQFHVIQENVLHVITASHTYQTKNTELSYGSKKIIVEAKDLNEPDIFPLILESDEIPWRLQLQYDLQQENFILFINDLAFLELPYQAEAVPPGPRNILGGAIKLNNVLVHEDWAPYTTSTFKDWCTEHKLQQITDVWIGDGFKSSSTEAVNALFDDIRRNADSE